MRLLIVFAAFLPAALAACCFPSTFTSDVTLGKAQFKVTTNFLKHRVVVAWTEGKVSYTTVYHTDTGKRFKFTHQKGQADKCQQIFDKPVEILDQCVPDDAVKIDNPPDIPPQERLRTYKYDVAPQRELSLTVDKYCLILKTSLVNQETNKVMRAMKWKQLSPCEVDKTLFDLECKA